MQVKVFGPNLTSAAQKKGAFHVHAADCGDIKHYGRGRKFGGEPGETEPSIEVESIKDVVMFVYPPEEFDYDEEQWTDYRSDVYLAPCVKL